MIRVTLEVGAIVVAACAFAQAAVSTRLVDGPEETGVALAVHPPVIRLDDATDRPRLVVVATLADGRTRDVTAEVELRLEREGLASIEAGRISPVAAGETRLFARWGGCEAEAAVSVVDAEHPRELSFHRDVVPVLTRRGCNAGGCHGSAAGKNGFKLSLFGYDPAKDHERLTRELRGRRVDVAQPERSLLLRKPSARVAHKGGKRIDEGDASYRVLSGWIEAGARLDDATGVRLTGIEIGPDEVVAVGPECRQQLIVRATYSDGSDRDVTEWAILSTSNETSARVDEHGLVTSHEPGEAFVMARYGTFAVVSQVLVLAAESEPPPPAATAAAASYVDRHIGEKLRKLRVAPVGLCTDEQLVRRLHLDVLNVLPTVDETRRFLADERPDKRERLIDAVLERPELCDLQAMQWAEVMKVAGRGNILKGKAVDVFTSWLRKAFRERMPFDELVRAVLTAKGGNFDNPPANFFIANGDPKVVAESTAQLFLGIRIQCAQCHNHPFERWTMDDYYGFAAFFSQMGVKRGEDPRERVIYHRGGQGRLRHLRDGSIATPRHLGGEVPDLEPGRDPREELADWMLDDANPWFAANVANRVFARCFGRGLVDPVDDVRVSNPPSHPALLDELAERLRSYDYDLRRLMRDILTSKAYQAAPARGVDTPFASAAVRRQTAEQLMESIAAVTEVEPSYPRVPPGSLVTAVPGAGTFSYFLRVFGRPQRTSACTCERRDDPTLGQALHLMNSNGIAKAIKYETGRLSRLLSEGKTDAEIVEELYLAAYSRFPTSDEKTMLLADLSGAEDRRHALEDLFWAVLNSKEFLFNH